MTPSQRQRIAIARAIVRNPKILVLDEVMTGMDEPGRDAVEKALENATRGRTAIFITRKDSLLKKCDKLMILGKRGQVIEEGTY